MKSYRKNGTNSCGDFQVIGEEYSSSIIYYLSSIAFMFKYLTQYQKRIWFHLLLLMGWLAIGTSLRFANLDGKHLWDDEFATLVFSLGNSFNSIPLDRLIDLDTLLQPLKPRPEAGVTDVVRHLMTESTHPPVFFALNHLWLKLFPTSGGLVLAWAGRSLSAIFGIISIPAIFALGSFAFRSLLVGQIAAAMMAVSPYGIYLAQEARHYTLTILFVIASIACLIEAVRTVKNRTPLPLWIVLIWVAVNGLGIAVHYFFSIALCAEALVLLRFWLADYGGLIRQKLQPLTHLTKPKKSPPSPPSNPLFLAHSPYWWRIYAALMGTAIAGLAWIPTLQRVSDNEMTKWVFTGNTFSNLLSPIIRLLAWLITMVVFLPVEGVSLPIAIASALGSIVFLLWVLSKLRPSFQIQIQQPTTSIPTQVLRDFTLAAIAIFLIITYIVGADLTIAARYHFIYFPCVTLLLASTLAVCWRDRRYEEKEQVKSQRSKIKPFNSRLLAAFTGQKVAILVLVMGFIGGLTVVSNLGFQKSTHPHILVAKIQQMSPVPIAIATFHETPHQARVLIELGWEFKRLMANSESPIISPQFILAHQEDELKPPIEIIDRAIAPMPRPLDLWLINSGIPLESKLQNCSPYFPKTQILPGHHHQLYHCR
jgi:uncharacterized membrane protein